MRLAPASVTALHTMAHCCVCTVHVCIVLVECTVQGVEYYISLCTIGQLGGSAYSAETFSQEANSPNTQYINIQQETIAQ